MNILDFVNRIKKRFGKTDVNALIDTTNYELTNMVLPFFKGALAKFVRDDSDLLSTFYRNDRDSIMTDFARSGYLRKSNPLAMVNESLINSVSILAYVKGVLDGSNQEDITPEGLTLVTSTALQLVELIAFVTEYSQAWLDVILLAESNHRNNINSEINITPALFKYLGDHRGTFGQLISILATPVDKIESMLDNMPDVVVSSANPKALMGTLGADRVDPLKLNLIQSKWDPFFLVGMLHSDYMASRYKRTKETMAMLELRVARLERQIQQKDDPRKAGIIEKYQGMIDKERGKIAKMEASVR